MQKKTFLVQHALLLIGRFNLLLKERKGIFCCLFSEYTCDESRENDSDVLLMHKRDLNPQKLETMQRDPEQIWLLWHDESNENSPNINKYKFNWTVTYRTSAEASLGAYGITIVKQKPWTNKELNSWVDEQFNERYNQAVW